MSDDTTQQGQASGVFVPPSVRQNYGELIALIEHSESMNDEERQYWIDLLPIMTPEQVKQLELILKNERDQLAAIDQKFAQNITSSSEPKRALEEIQQERQQKNVERLTREQKDEQQESSAEEEILKKVQEL